LGRWLKFTLGTMVPLATNKTYGFDITSNGSQNRLFETYGISNNVYAGGTAYRGNLDGMPSGPDTVFNALVGDRVFLVELDPYVPGPPQISQQPADIAVPLSGTPAFTVQLLVAAGATYQWYRGITNILGATNSTYSFSPMTANDDGAQFY